MRKGKKTGKRAGKQGGNGRTARRGRSKWKAGKKIGRGWTEAVRGRRRKKTKM